MLHNLNKAPPFYGSYALFERAVSYWKKNGTPKRFASASIRNAVGTDASRIISGLRGLDWIDDDGLPSKSFKAAVDAYGEESWYLALRTAVEQAYSFIPTPWSDLTSASLRGAFRNFIGRETSIIPNAETFFLTAAVAARIELPDTFANRISRSRSRIHDSSSGKLFEQEPQHFSNGNGLISSPKDEVRPPVDVLFSLFDEGVMSEKEKAALVTLAFHLQKHGVKTV
jgi:hypothetical protein